MDIPQCLSNTRLIPILKNINKVGDQYYYQLKDVRMSRFKCSNGDVQADCSSTSNPSLNCNSLCFSEGTASMCSGDNNYRSTSFYKQTNTNVCVCSSSNYCYSTTTIINGKELNVSSVYVPIYDESSMSESSGSRSLLQFKETCYSNWVKGKVVINCADTLGSPLNAVLSTENSKLSTKNYEMVDSNLIISIDSNWLKDDHNYHLVITDALGSKVFEEYKFIEGTNDPGMPNCLFCSEAIYWWGSWNVMFKTVTFMLVFLAFSSCFWGLTSIVKAIFLKIFYMYKSLPDSPLTASVKRSSEYSKVRAEEMDEVRDLENGVERKLLIKPNGIKAAYKPIILGVCLALMSPVFALTPTIDISKCTRKVVDGANCASVNSTVVCDIDFISIINFRTMNDDQCFALLKNSDNKTVIAYYKLIWIKDVVQFNSEKLYDTAQYYMAYNTLSMPISTYSFSSNNKLCVTGNYDSCRNERYLEQWTLDQSSTGFTTCTVASGYCLYANLKPRVVASTIPYQVKSTAGAVYTPVIRFEQFNSNGEFVSSSESVANGLEQRTETGFLASSKVLSKSRLASVPGSCVAIPYGANPSFAAYFSDCTSRGLLAPFGKLGDTQINAETSYNTASEYSFAPNNYQDKQSYYCSVYLTTLTCDGTKVGGSGLTNLRNGLIPNSVQIYSTVASGYKETVLHGVSWQYDMATMSMIGIRKKSSSSVEVEVSLSKSLGLVTNSLICPIIGDMIVTGCMNCDSGATLIFDASSKCSPGSVFATVKGFSILKVETTVNLVGTVNKYQINFYSHSKDGILTLELHADDGVSSIQTLDYSLKLGTGYVDVPNPFPDFFFKDHTTMDAIGKFFGGGYDTGVAATALSSAAIVTSPWWAEPVKRLAKTGLNLAVDYGLGFLSSRKFF